ncbi:hypothetical protein B296_00042084 [Ensete ventricosum]|uniref:Uncharacterized protein n=1 Tax=Ensete ventricosum TaxID=4639 RepID=A0A426X389_ENSVE|nr:hypothetical protein B296_00042084 [Ensete ventricosum]
MQGRPPTAARGSPTARVAACKGGLSCRGSACARRHRPPIRCRSRAAAPVAGAAAHADGVQRRHLRRVAVATIVQLG